MFIGLLVRLVISQLRNDWVFEGMTPRLNMPPVVDL